MVTVVVVVVVGNPTGVKPGGVVGDSAALSSSPDGGGVPMAVITVTVVVVIVVVTTRGVDGAGDNGGVSGSPCAPDCGAYAFSRRPACEDWRPVSPEEKIFVRSAMQT